MCLFECENNLLSSLEVYLFFSNKEGIASGRVVMLVGIPRDRPNRFRRPVDETHPQGPNNLFFVAYTGTGILKR